MSIDGIQDVYLREGNVMDSASIQQVEQVIENQLILFLPPYSPDLNPTEEVFSQVKAIMKELCLKHQLTDFSNYCIRNT